MTECYQEPMKISRLKGRNIEAEFSGGDITSDGGALLLREIDKKMNLCHQVAKVFKDPRDPSRITHEVLSMVRQRIFGIALAYEDLNDHETLRKDPAMQTATGCLDDLASPSTLCRLEQWADRKAAIDLHQVLFDQFVNRYKTAPEEIILDFDATDDLTHGDQVGRFYHGYYRHECFLPLHVYCGHFPLVSYLRPSFMDPAKHTWAILALLVKGLRQRWPEVKIIFRGDAGFHKEKILRWCDKHDVKYIVGFGQNAALLRAAQPLLEAAESTYKTTLEKQRVFGFVTYQAASWKQEREVLVKAEHSVNGSNPRAVITNLSGEAQYLYDQVYCARGDMENRIKEIQLDLFSDRTSCHEWWPNQLRLLFSTMAYALLNALREGHLSGTRWVKARLSTIRIKLLKVGAIILRNTRRIRFLLSSNYPYQFEFKSVLVSLKADTS